MSRYIDADAYAAEMKTRQDALKELMDDADALDNWEMYDGLSRAFSVFVEAKLTLDNMPTVDAVPVVHGEWVGYPECLKYINAYSDDHIVCSVCEECFSIIDNDCERFNYCPNCGAKMDGKENANDAIRPN